MRPNKFNAVKTVIDGHTFASKKEAARYQELKLLQSAGEIESLRLQPTYKLLGQNGEPVCKYIADFEYTIPERGIIVEDVKSKATKTPVYRLKKKLFEAQFSFKIMEV